MNPPVTAGYLNVVAVGGWENPVVIDTSYVVEVILDMEQQS